MTMSAMRLFDRPRLCFRLGVIGLQSMAMDLQVARTVTIEVAGAIVEELGIARQRFAACFSELRPQLRVTCVGSEFQFVQLLASTRAGEELSGSPLIEIVSDQIDWPATANVALLLRNLDMLVVVADSPEERPTGDGSIVYAALALAIPVVLIGARSGQLRFLDSGATPTYPFATALGNNLPADAELVRLRDAVAALLQPADSTNPVLQNFFDTILPTRQRGLRQWVWIRFESLFREQGYFEQELAADTNLSAIRRRASQLSQHYAGLYRGAFLLNYLLAVVAVGLGATSLILMGATHTELSRVLAAALRTNAAAIAPASAFLLILVTLSKLAVVGCMMRNTSVANKEKWNEKAINFRYLAEQLRCVPFLQLAGSGQAPRSSRSVYSSRAVRQGTVDWLVGALVRNFDWPALAELDPAVSLEKIKTHWLSTQILYHEANTRMLSRIEDFTARWSKRINRIVMAAVGIDLLTLTMNWLGWLPESLSTTITLMSPALVFLAALLPAVVASLSGIRFQSECGRLAERSAVVTQLLKARVREADQLLASIALDDPPQRPERLAEVLRLAENIARDLVDEVAEWSVLYQKELRAR